jgi:hypothetical protein
MKLPYPVIHPPERPRPFAHLLIYGGAAAITLSLLILLYQII